MISELSGRPRVLLSILDVINPITKSQAKSDG